MKEYEKLKKQEDDELLEKCTAEDSKRITNFLKSESNIVSKPIDGFKSGT